MALIHDGLKAFMLLENHLFHLPSTLTKRENIREYDLGSSPATCDDAPKFLFSVGASYNELVSLADIRCLCDVVVTKPYGAPLTAPLNVTAVATP